MTRSLLLFCFSWFLSGLSVTGISLQELDRESVWLGQQGGTDRLYGLEEHAKSAPEEGNARTDAGQVEPAAGPRWVSKRDRTRRELLEEVDLRWERPSSPAWQEDEAAPQDEEMMRNRLAGIFVPKVEFRQVPLSKVLEALAEMAARDRPEGEPLNIVLIDPDGRDPYVSILLRRLDLRRVLDFVVESVGYEYDMKPDAIVVRPGQGPGFGLETAFYPLSRSTMIRLTGIHEMESMAAGEIVDPFALPDAGPVDNRGQAERALLSFLQRAGIPFEGVEGANLALADGQLIVTQTPRNHEKVKRLLRRYREIKQVEIEARFLEVQERNLEELGFEWTLLGTGSDRLSNAPTRNLANTFTVGKEESRVVIDRPGFNLPDVGQGPPVLPITVDLAEDAGPLLTLDGRVEGVDLQVLLRALERQSGNDLLSAPKLTVLSGKTAEIVVAEEFRYPEIYGDTDAEVGMGDSTSGSAGVAITAGTPRSFTTRNVGVEMEVTPTVEEDGAISLLLKPKVTEFEGFVEYGGTSVAIASDTTVTVPSGFYQPVFSIRKVQTEVTIWDGATVVMGGLTREHSVRISDRVPLLGDLPLLGRLFRNEGKSTQKRNLLIFVTASLVSPGGSPAFQRVADDP